MLSALQFSIFQKQFSIKDFFSKCDQIRRKLRIWSHLLKKSIMEIFIFCAVYKRCSVRKGVLRNFAKFTRKHLRQTLFFNKVVGWGDYFLYLHLSCVFSWKFLVYFISTEKRNEKAKYPDGVQIFTFLHEYRFLWRQRFQKKFGRW